MIFAKAFGRRGMLAFLVLGLPLFVRAEAVEKPVPSLAAIEPFLGEALAHWRGLSALPLESEAARLSERDSRFSAWAPRASANASAGLSGSSRWADGKNLDEKADPDPGVSAGVSLSWNVFNGGRDSLRTSGAGLEAELKGHEQKVAEAQVEAQVLADLLGLVQAEERLVQVQREASLWLELQRGIEAKVKGGLLPQGALSEMGIEISELKSREVSLSEKLHAEVAAFNRRHGLRNHPLAVAGLRRIRQGLASLVENGRELLSSGRLPEEARSRNPYLQATLLRTSLLDVQSRLGDPRSLRPSVDLTASAGVSPEVHWSKAPLPDYDYGTNWSVSLGISLPLFSGDDWSRDESLVLKRQSLARTLESEQEKRRDIAQSAMDRLRILQLEREQKSSLVRARQVAVKEREAFTGAGISAVDELIRARQTLQRAEADLLSNQQEQDGLSLQAELLVRYGIEVRM